MHIFQKSRNKLISNEAQRSPMKLVPTMTTFLPGMRPAITFPSSGVRRVRMFSSSEPGTSSVRGLQRDGRPRAVTNYSSWTLSGEREITAYGPCLDL